MRRALSRRAGYTLVEVMLAVSVLFVGATGFTLLAGASTRAVQTAQDHTVGLQVMETWADRVRRDASRWRQAGVTNTQDTVYLQAGMATPGQWIVPALVTDDGGETIAPGADAWGWDQAPGAKVRFCTLLRYQVAHNITQNSAVLEDTIRVDIMTWRPRPGDKAMLSFTDSEGGTVCSASAANSGQLDISGVFKAVTSILVRWQ